MRRFWPILVLAAGCERDPTFFGYWELVAAEHDGVRQPDTGFLEVNDDASVSLFLRYRFSGGAFEPDPRPRMIFGDTDASRQEFLGNYAEKGEVHRLLLTPFGAETRFRVDEYHGDWAVLSAPDAFWPGGSQPLETVLELER